jgi:hypothetical protein
VREWGERETKDRKIITSSGLTSVLTASNHRRRFQWRAAEQGGIIDNLADFVGVDGRSKS